MSFTSSSSYKAHKTKLEMNEMERERKNEKKMHCVYARCSARLHYFLHSLRFSAYSHDFMLNVHKK